MKLKVKKLNGYCHQELQFMITRFEDELKSVVDKMNKTMA